MDYSKMKYNDLKAEAKNQGLDASGTKEELIARLSGSGEKPPAPAKKSVAKPSDEADENDGDDVDSEDDSEEDVKPSTPAKKAVAVKQSATQLHRTRALKMKEKLDKQPKVRVLIPFNSGENPEQAKKIAFHVNLNGWTIDIPRGVMVDVPEQVAKVVYERLESEGRIGSQYRIDADEKRQEALS